MKTKLLRWYRRRRFLKAYRILRDEVKRHQDAGHEMYFVAVNESLIKVECMHCPELRP